MALLDLTTAKAFCLQIPATLLAIADGALLRKAEAVFDQGCVLALTGRAADASEQSLLG